MHNWIILSRIQEIFTRQSPIDEPVLYHVYRVLDLPACPAKINERLSGPSLQASSK